MQCCKENLPMNWIILTFNALNKMIYFQLANGLRAWWLKFPNSSVLHLEIPSTRVQCPQSWYRIAKVYRCRELLPRCRLQHDTLIGYSDFCKTWVSYRILEIRVVCIGGIKPGLHWDYRSISRHILQGCRRSCHTGIDSSSRIHLCEICCRAHFWQGHGRRCCITTWLRNGLPPDVIACAS